MVSETYRALAELLVDVYLGDETATNFDLVLYNENTDGIRTASDPVEADISTEPSGYTRASPSLSNFTHAFTNGDNSLVIPAVTIDVSGVTSSGSDVDSVAAVETSKNLDSVTGNAVIASASIVEGINASEIALETITGNLDIDAFELVVSPQ